MSDNPLRYNEEKSIDVLKDIRENMYVDGLDESLPYVTELTGDEIFPVIQDSKKRLADLIDQVRLVAAKRAGLMFNSLAQAMVLVTTLALPLGSIIATACYATPGDGGDATYERVATEPTEGEQDTAGNWWALRVAVVRAEMFGAIEDNAGDAFALCQAAANYGARYNGIWQMLPKTYLVSDTIVIPRANGSGGVSGEVKRFQIIGMGGTFSDSGTIVKAFSSTDAVFATEAWATNTILYQSGVALTNITIDGDGFAAHGIATTAADAVFSFVYIRNCTDTGLLHARTLQNGTTNSTRPDRCRFYNLMIRDCGTGFTSLDSAGCTMAMAEVWHCNICVDVAGSGWQIDNLRTYTNATDSTYVSRLNLGQGSRVTNCIWGGASGKPDVYQLDLIHRFDPIMISDCEFSGPAGKGLRVSTQQANGRGLIMITDSVFTNEAGATTSSIWMGTNDAEFLVDVVNCVFRIGADDYPFAWETGAEAGQIYARNCRKISASAEGVLVVYEGIQRPNIFSTNNPGVLVSGANPVTLTYASKRSIIRNAALTSATSYVLPDTAGEGQIFEFTRSFAATGNFIFSIYLGEDVIATLPVAGWYVRVMYAPTVTPSWVVVESTPLAQPQTYGVNLPGVLVTGANPYTIVASTPAMVVRNVPLISTTAWILPAIGGNGQSYTFIRSAAATGAFDLNITLSDGSTVLKALPSASYRVAVTYSSQAAAWIVTEAEAIA